MDQQDPLILITNDDGIRSPGLRAAVRAVQDLGELLVVAPSEQQSSAGRSFIRLNQDVPRAETLSIGGVEVRAYAVNSGPAPAVRWALLAIAERTPDLCISGINYGENLGVGVTISGTVGAAMEAASFGIPALAVSVQTHVEDHYNHSEAVDFSTAAYFLRLFARRVLERGLPEFVDILKVDVPMDATPETPWRITRVSRQHYFQSIVVDEGGYRRLIGYDVHFDRNALEPDSDIWAMAVDKVVSVSPLTIDLTAYGNWTELERVLREG